MSNRNHHVVYRLHNEIRLIEMNVVAAVTGHEMSTVSRHRRKLRVLASSFPLVNGTPVGDAPGQNYKRHFTEHLVTCQTVDA